ncbi:MAG TPA: hypothetical protein VHR17_06625 [Thermoanaerobaculia bacterium]|nr:hypothetical protein [Thermoanaerobaculia bacterium]
MVSPRAERWSLGILFVANGVAWAAAVAAQAPSPEDHGPTLRSVRVAFDTSARSSPAVGPFAVNVSVDGLGGGDRIPIVDAIELTVERNVSVPAVFELTLRDPIAKRDLDQVLTTLSVKNAIDRFVFHYTLTLTFGGAGDDVFLQKVYAVTLDSTSPLAMTQTRIGEPSTESAIERAYAELEATYALMEEAIEDDRRDVASQPPIWNHHVLGSLRVEGDQAVMTVLQAYSRMQLVDGTLRKVESSVTRDETWVKTPEGWKRRLVENERDTEWFVDGKRVRLPVAPPRGAAPTAP